MVIALLLAISYSQSIGPVKIVGDFSGDVQAIGWTPSGQLLQFTGTKVHEWPSGRTATVGAAPTELEPPYEWSLNSDGSKGILGPYEVDFRALSVRLRSDKAVWADDKLLSLTYDAEWRTVLTLDSKKKLLQGKHVLGVSSDGRFILASDKSPEGDVDTHLVSFDSHTHETKIIATFPKSSNDHELLRIVSYNPTAKSWLIIRWEGASGFMHPYLLDGELHHLVLPEGRGIETSSYAVWVSESSSWIAVQRRFFDEDEVGGYDAWALDLYNVETKQFVRAASRTNPFTTRDAEITRGDSPSLMNFAIDSATKRIAYSVKSKGRTRVFVRSFVLP